jgi:hypothetical protein
MCSLCVALCKPTNLKKERYFENTNNVIFQINIKRANSNTALILIKINLTTTLNLIFALKNENNISQDAPKMRNPKGWRYAHDFRITRSFHVSITLQSGPGQRSWYNDSLRARRSWNLIPVGVNFLHSFKPVLGPTRPPVKWVLGYFPRGSATGS